MDGYLRQSTASQTRTIGPFVDDTDFKSLENGLTIANTDVKIKANGAASASKNSGGATADGSGGLYHLTWDATDTAVVGELKYVVSVAGALVVFGSYVVLEEAVYDALFAVSAPGYLQPTTAGRTLDVSAGGEAGIDLANVGSPTTTLNLSGTTIKTATDVETDTADIQSKIGTPASTVSADVAAVKAETATILADTNELQTDWADGGRLDLILDARASQASVNTIDGIVDDILVDTTEIGAAGAGLSAIPWNASWDAQVESEVADALAVYDPPTKAELDSAVSPLATSAALGTVDTVVDAIKVTTDKLDDTLEDDAGTFRFTTNALEQAPTGGSAPTAADIADAVWEEAIADHSGTAGSTAEQLAAAGSAGDPWATALPGSYTSGQAGKIVGDNLNATVSSRASQTSVDDVPTNAELATALGTADDAVLTAIGDLPTNAELATALGSADDAVLAAIGALNNLSQANIRTAVGLASANLDTQLAALPTAQEITDAVLDEATAGHQTAGTVGKAITDAQSAGDPWASELETGVTASTMLRAAAAVAAGKTDITDLGGGAATVVFRDISDASDIIEATMAGSERTAVTVTP